MVRFCQRQSQSAILFFLFLSNPLILCFIWADSFPLPKYLLALYLNSPKTKGNLFYLNVQFVPRSKQCPLLLKKRNQLMLYRTKFLFVLRRWNFSKLTYNLPIDNRSDTWRCHFVICVNEKTETAGNIYRSLTTTFVELTLAPLSQKWGYDTLRHCVSTSSL